MASTEYFALPHAYSSSYNAILPQTQLDDPNFDPWMDRSHRLDKAVIVALMTYLDAPILRYFAALFGSSHLANTGRFELEELRSIPCPFESIEDPAFLALAECEDADAAILRAMKAGDEFKATCREFRDFRGRFGNANVPDDSFAEPEPEVVSAYLERLRAEIAAALPLGTPIEIDPTQDGENVVPSAIHLEFQHGMRQPFPTPRGRFISTSIVEAYGSGTAAVIWNSACRHAWTVEQAVADAQVVIRERHHHALEHRNTARD